jgi:hypothetical protein
VSAYAKVGIALAAIVFGFMLGWLVQGLRKDALIADMKMQAATNVATQATAALDDLAAATAVIKSAANSAQSNNRAVITKLSSIEKGLKNVQNQKPLPVDCKPDSSRVQSLNSAIEAANSSFARSVPGK